MKKRRSKITIAGLCLVMVFCGLAGAKEPKLPNVNKSFDAEKEARLARLSTLDVSQCYEQLKEADFLFDNDFTNKAAYKCFRNRKAEAIAYAVDMLKQPAYRVEGETLVQNYDLNVAKTVLRVFAPNVEVILLKTYRKGSAETRANLLYVAGQMVGNKARELLIEALDDQTVYEKPYPEMEGKPLRVCDMAYNQLRLRYADELVDLPRTIANSHRIETRNSYIDEMYSRF